MEDTKVENMDCLEQIEKGFQKLILDLAHEITKGKYRRKR